MTSARGRFDARLIAGFVTAMCALGLGAVVVAAEGGSPGGLTGAPGRPAAAHAPHGVVHAAVLLADRRSAAISVDAARGRGGDGHGSSKGGQPSGGPGISGVAHSANDGKGSSGPGGGRGNAGNPPGHSDAGPGHSSSAPGHGGSHGRKSHGQGAAAPPPPGHQRIESVVTLTPPPTPGPAAPPSPSGTASRPPAPGLTASSGTPSAPSRGAGATTRLSPAPRGRGTSHGSGSTGGVPAVLAPFVAGLPPLSLLPMVGGLQVGGAPQIAVFVLLANALLAGAIVLTSRRGRRLTRRSLEGGAGLAAVRGAGEDLEEWPSAS